MSQLPGQLRKALFFDSTKKHTPKPPTTTLKPNPKQKSIRKLGRNTGIANRMVLLRWRFAQFFSEKTATKKHSISRLSLQYPLNSPRRKIEIETNLVRVVTGEFDPQKTDDVSSNNVL